MSKANGHAPPDPLDELDDVIAELEGTEWDDDEITAEHYIHAEPGANVTVVTGKHAAMSKDQADEITLTDHGTKKPSEPPQSETPKAARSVVAILKAVNNPYALGALALLVVALFIWLKFR